MNLVLLKSLKTISAKTLSKKPFWSMSCLINNSVYFSENRYQNDALTWGFSRVKNASRISDFLKFPRGVLINGRSIAQYTSNRGNLSRGIIIWSVAARSVVKKKECHVLVLFVSNSFWSGPSHFGQDRIRLLLTILL